MQAVLIAFSFGAFLEGAAGFGTPVAITAAMLIGLGFRPRTAAGLALIGNTAPVAFGGLGTPIVALAKVTGLAPELLGANIGRQLTPFALIVPFWLIASMCGFRRMREVWPACLTAGLSFSVTQLVISNYFGPSLVDIIASVVSIVAMLVLLRFWKPKTVWRFEHDAVDDSTVNGASGTSVPEYGPAPAILDDPAAVQPIALDYATGSNTPAARQTVIAWMPWVILSIIMFAWGMPAVKAHLNNLSSFNIPIKATESARSSISAGCEGTSC